MRQWNIRHRLDFGYLHDSQIGLPSAKSKERIVVRAEVLRHSPVASNGLIEHSAECDTVECSGLDTEPGDPAGVLIHDDQDPVGSQGGRCAPEQIDTPEAVLQVAPGKSARRNHWRPVSGDSDWRESFEQCPYRPG
jgi:hypothetical protein